MINETQKDSPEPKLLPCCGSQCDTVTNGCGFANQETCQFLQFPRAAQPNEAFLSLFFDAQQYLISFEALLCGSNNGTTVYKSGQLVDAVVEQALQHQATAVTFMHYYPSFEGDCPMPTDLILKQWLLDVLEADQIQLIDYLVMGKGGSVSL